MAHMTWLPSARTFLTPPVDAIRGGKWDWSARQLPRGPSGSLPVPWDSYHLPLAAPDQHPLLFWWDVTLLVARPRPVKHPQSRARRHGPKMLTLHKETPCPALTSMVITSTWTLLGRARSGWKRLARATRRCKVASRSLLKMAGRGEGCEVRATVTAQTWGNGEGLLRSQPPSEDRGDLCPASGKQRPGSLRPH